MERKHPKDTVKCFFYSTLSICVNRFQLQYIFLKVVFSKWIFSPTLSHKSPLQYHLHTPNFTFLFLSISWRFLLKDLFIYNLLDYNISIPLKLWKYSVFCLFKVFSELLSDNEIPKIPSVKTFDSVKKKWNKNFEIDFQCLDFCTRNVCQLAHI